jgi:hypothetical protein
LHLECTLLILGAIAASTCSAASPTASLTLAAAAQQQPPSQAYLAAPFLGASLSSESESLSLSESLSDPELELSDPELELLELLLSSSLLLLSSSLAVTSSSSLSEPAFQKREACKTNSTIGKRQPLAASACHS